MLENSNPLVLDVNDVRKSFAGKQAVRGVSFQVRSGEIVGFLGPNGAGKTTTLRMALGLIAPDSGTVKLFGQAPGPSAFGRVGFLPEERGLYAKISARDGIAHIACLNGMKRKDALKRADDMLERYGLGDVARKKIKTLSKGMAQKVQLIAAIAHDPEFLILDEPFSGLDPVNQKLLEDMVREIAGRGRTIVFSTHVMEHAERLCDKIVLLSQGQKIFDGDLKQALSYAPRRLEIETPDPKAEAVFTPLAQQITRNGDTYNIVLKPDKEAQHVLAESMKATLSLIRFEPEKPSLHEAFVTLVANGDKS
ncbi:MAG: ATP-binding cassette domain-containing protein [Robiginitomaculum sp.]|nr:ATP-binding cassette domain-containing protein [Robiginitomaculum sp.]